VGHRSLERALLGLSIALALIGGVVISVRARIQTAPADPVAAYLNALVRHEYKTAYELTDLPRLRLPPSSSGITLRHFEAFQRAHPLQSWRRLGRVAELLAPNGTRTRVDLALDGGLVSVPVSTVEITAPTGPLPSLSIDGVSIPVRAVPLPSAPAVGSFRYRYALAVLRGVHTFDVGAGPVTAPVRFRRNVNPGDNTAERITIELRTSGKGNDAAARAIRAIMGTCPDDLCLVPPCAEKGATYVLESGYDLIVGRAIVPKPMPRDGWSIAVTFIDQAQPAVFKGGAERTTTLRARYTFGFVPGRQPQLLDRCWLAQG
jgi:hypothetical protein